MDADLKNAYEKLFHDVEAEREFLAGLLPDPEFKHKRTLPILREPVGVSQLLTMIAVEADTLEDLRAISKFYNECASAPVDAARKVYNNLQRFVSHDVLVSIARYIQREKESGERILKLVETNFCDND